MPLDDTPALYSIGAVASLTGLSTSTLRSWERRHGAVTPRRTPNGGRRYTESQVERLQLINTLTRAGVSIGQIASMPTDALRTRVDALQDAPWGLAEDPSGVGFLHRSLGDVVRSAAMAWLDVVVAADSVAELSGTRASRPIDVVFVELPLLGADPGEAVQEIYDATSARLVVAEYTFAKAATLEALVEAGAWVVHGPLRVSDVARIVTGTRTDGPGFIAPSVPSDAPEPRFTQERLARIRELAPDNACECPNHIATLVTSLTAFEEYSRSCVSENPKDRELHAGLALGTSRARAVMEELLMRLCEHEGIEV